MEKASELRVFFYESADVRQDSQQFEVVEKIISKLLSCFGVFLPGPLEKFFQIGERVFVIEDFVSRWCIRWRALSAGTKRPSSAVFVRCLRRRLVAGLMSTGSLQTKGSRLLTLGILHSSPDCPAAETHCSYPQTRRPARFSPASPIGQSTK